MSTGILDPLLPTENLIRLEQLKFRVDPKNPDSVVMSSSGDVTISGLKTAGSFVELTINSTTWTLVTVTNTVRNHIWCQNQSQVQMKFNPAQASGYVGIILEPGQSANIDIQDDIPIYFKSESGASNILGRLELA